MCAGVRSAATNHSKEGATVTVLRHGLSSVPHAECGEEEETGNEGEREREGSSSCLTSSPSVGGDSLEDVGLQDDFFKYYQQPANLNHSNNRESVV